jgi:hypothetical protein
MDTTHIVSEIAAASRQLSRGVVEAVLETEVMVAFGADRRLLCDILQVSEAAPLVLVEGDRVLVWTAPEPERGVVLGRILSPSNPRPEVDEIVIKARKNLTIECGEGSITLRGDGKVLIKGKDLVSRAQRMNRIKGGSVALN